MPPVTVAKPADKPVASVNGAKEPAVVERKLESHPWSSPSSVVDKQGLSMMLFAFPGIGKTTIGLTMVKSKDGGPMLIVNTDEELRSISDLDEDSGVKVWPGANSRTPGKVGGWPQFKSFTSKLLAGKHPFKGIMFDTLNSMYDFALTDVKARNPSSKDPRQTYGEANDMVLELVGDFCAISREQGLNVLFNCHAEERQVGENGPLYIRPKITPGVVQGINQRVSMIGYLEPGRMGRPRSLQLAASARIATKIHQPRSGPQIPDKISNPNLGKLIDHIKYKMPYPVKKEGE